MVTTVPTNSQGELSTQGFSMNYYPHHIGDFNNATRHLTRLERSIYRDLIELYYDSEGPLTLDVVYICKKILANSVEEITTVEQVLNEYFEETEDGYINNRCQKVIDEYQNSIHNKSKAGKASAKARKANKTKALKDSTGVQQVSNSRSTGVHNQNQEPEPRTRTSKDSKKDKIPYQQIADLYNNNFAIPSLNPEVAKLNNERKRLIKILWLTCTDSDDETKLTNSLEYWARYFDYCSGIKFLRGDTERSESHKNWRPDLNYMMKEKTYIQVLEGAL